VEHKDRQEEVALDLERSRETHQEYLLSQKSSFRALALVFLILSLEVILTEPVVLTVHLPESFAFTQAEPQAMLVF
jgi:hypothetical protein